MGLVIAKVGGSLFDLPDLRCRLRNWVETVGPSVLLVPGGGEAADVIRRLDRAHGLGEESAHWLALRVLSVNADFLAGLLGTPVVSTVTSQNPALAVLDPHALCQADEGRSGALPHGWHTTSDAIAARVAEIAAARLVLLKSTDLTGGMTWAAATAAGLVDETFGAIVTRAGLRPEWVNLRSLDGIRR